MLAETGIPLALWALVAAAVLGPLVAVLLVLRDRTRLAARLGNLEEILRRLRSMDPTAQFDERANEPLQLSRERIVLNSLLDRFPEVTQKFVLVATIEELGQVLLSSFERILESGYGAVFVREENVLRLTARAGLEEAECPPGLEIPMGHDRIGYAAQKCLILRPGDFATLDPRDQVEVEGSRVIPREFDFYVPLVHRGTSIGCVAVGGMKKVVQKAHSVCMALANLGALVITNIQRADEIRELSEEDPLTRLSNRRHCYQLLAERVLLRNTAPFALFLFDIDHFKRINDTHGHALGDAVLVRLADEARRFVHPEEGEFACRFGGEEFLCLLGCDDVPSLAARIEAFRMAVAGIRLEVSHGRESPQVRISGGVAFCPAEHEDADALIRLADDRLYLAKESGRNRVMFESTRTTVHA